MFSPSDVRSLAGPAAYARGAAYQRDGRVRDLAWSLDRTALTASVTGATRAPYGVKVQMHTTPTGDPVPTSGTCSCPVGSNCTHVVAVLLEAVHRAADGDTRPPAAWRADLGPAMQDLDSGTVALGVQFELLPQATPKREDRRTATPPPRLGVRPIRRNERGRWVRTSVSWRDIAHSAMSLDYDAHQISTLRDLHALLTGASTVASASEAWLHVERCSNEALWRTLAAARKAEVPLVMSDREATPVRIASEVAAPTMLVERHGGDLLLRPALAVGDPGDAVPIAPGYGFIGDPAIGVYTWGDPGDPNDHTVTLVPFGTPLAPAARAMLEAAEPIRVAAADESAFLTEHYPRLSRVFRFESLDGSFTPPQLPEPTLHLVLEHRPGGTLEGLWSWRYSIPHDTEAGVEVPLATEAGALFRAPGKERRILATVGEHGITAAHTPELIEPTTGALRPAFTLHGAATAAFLAGPATALGALDRVRVTELGTPTEFRAATEAPVVHVGTTESGEGRDWFDLEIRVTVGDETVPIAELFRALARGDETLVLASGTFFPLDDERFSTLRALIIEARTLSDAPRGPLRISRYQTSLWEDLASLGVVDRQAAAWRHAVEALSPTGTLPSEPIPPGFTATLRPYQHVGFNWLSYLYDHGLGGVLADDMGLGKTVQSMALVARAAANGARFLVVAPTSVVGNWVAEAHRFAPGLRVVGIDRTARKRGLALTRSIDDAQLVITSYALFRLDFDSYDAIAWDGLLLDEAQFVKNRASVTHQLLRRLQVPFALAITGTPLENGLDDLWSIFSIIAPGLFPSAKAFADQYQKPIERDGDTVKLEQLKRRIRPLLLRRTKEVVAPELPPRQEQVIEVELNPRQRRIYDMHLARERQRVLGLIDDFDRNRFAIFRSLTVLRQLALDASLVDQADAGVPSSKLDLLDELLEDALSEGHRVLVFSQFTRFLGKVRDRLRKAGVEHAYLDGRTRGRAEEIDRFRSGAVPVFLISLKAGGFGLNLTEADYCILLDPWWNPAAEAQAVDRAHRIGQQRTVHVYRLVSKHTIEEKVVALGAAKAELALSVLGDEADASATGLSAADVRALLG